MAELPDLTDPRYLHEVGWFLLQRKYRDVYQGGSYEDYRHLHSGQVKEEVLSYVERDERWLEDKTVVAVGSGCSCELMSWRARVKVEIDPLLYAYQQLAMLLDDEEGTSPSVRMAVAVENLPLLDDFAHLVLCRNALDHFPNPAAGLREMLRILKPDGMLFLSVDIGGEPTPDEPNPFGEESLTALLEAHATVAKRTGPHPSHSRQRDYSVRVVARAMRPSMPLLDADEVASAYEALLDEERS